MPALPPDLRRVGPDEFVAARDALARRLRQAGDREAASEVRRLRRPSAPLWALNGLAEAAPERLAHLLDAGAALRNTTQQALRGDAAKELGRLAGEHTHLVGELTDVAAGLCLEAGTPMSRDVRARLWQLIRAVSLSPDATAALTAGALADEPVSVGFDSLEGLEVPEEAPDDAATVAEPPPPPTSGRRPRAAAAELRRAAEAARVAADAVDVSRHHLSALRQRIDGLAQDLEAARREATRAEADVAEREAAAEVARAAHERLQMGPDRSPKPSRS